MSNENLLLPFSLKRNLYIYLTQAMYGGIYEFTLHGNVDAKLVVKEDRTKNYILVQSSLDKQSDWKMDGSGYSGSGESFSGSSGDDPM